jgi:hypothetical protein
MATFADWSETGAPTVSVETSKVFHGVSSAKVVAGGSIGQLTQVLTDNVDGNIIDLIGKSTVAKCAVWASVASAGRIRLDWDGGTTLTSSDYHDGTSEWQTLEIDTSVPTGATQVEITLETAANQTVYFDGLYVAIDRIARYTIPATLVRDPSRVREQYIYERPRGTYYEIHPQGAPTRGRALVLEGMGLLSRPTTDAGTTEVAGAQVNLIVAKARELMYLTLAGRATGDDRKDFLADAKIGADEADRLMTQPGVRMRPMSAEVNPAWHVERTASASTLVFDRVQ